MDQVKIGAFIAQLRRERDWTQEELGERLGVTNKTVSRWENGNYMPSIELLALMGREFDVSLNELLEGRRLDNEAEFRAAADKNLASAMESRLDRFWKWMERYGAYAAVIFLLCCIIGVLSAVLYYNRLAYPHDALPVGTWGTAYTHFADDLTKYGEYIVLDRDGRYYRYRQFEPLEQGLWEAWDPSIIRVTVGDKHRDVVIKRSILYASNEEGVLEEFRRLSDVPSFINVSPEEFEK